MKKVLATFCLAVFLLGVLIFTEAETLGETQPDSLNSSALELN